MLALAAPRAAGAPPAFRVPNPLRYVLTDRSSVEAEVAFFVFASEGTITDASITVRGIQAPGAEFLPIQAVKQKEMKIDGPVTPEGRRVALPLTRDFFVYPGDYQIELLIRGQPRGDGPMPTAPVVLPVSLTVVRESPVLDLDRLNGLTVTLFRPFPWYTAPAKKVSLSLTNSGRVMVHHLAPAGQEVLVKDRKELASGRVEATEEPADLSPDGRASLDLNLVDFDTAGDFTASVVLRSPSLGKSERITLNIRVADRWFFPWLVLFLGVALAFAVNYLAERWRPVQENRYRIVRLQAELDSFRLVTSSPAKLQQLQAITDTLRRADERNTLGDAAGARSLLDQGETAVAAFRTADVQAKATAWHDLEDLQHQLTTLGTHQAQMNANQVGCWKAFRDDLDRAADRLTEGRLDETQTVLADIRSRCQQLRAELAQANVPAFALALAGPATSAALRILDPADARTTDTSLTFRMKPVAGQLADQDRYHWEFGDGGPERITANPQTRHRFESVGVYLVKVSVEPGAALPPDARVASLRVAVGPGRSERKLEGVRRALFMADLVTSGISLLVASLTGLLALYIGKAFGSMQDYLTIFLWGFGIDASVRGIAEVFKKVAHR